MLAVLVREIRALETANGERAARVYLTTDDYRTLRDEISLATRGNTYPAGGQADSILGVPLYPGREFSAVITARGGMVLLGEGGRTRPSPVPKISKA